MFKNDFESSTVRCNTKSLTMFYIGAKRRLGKDPFSPHGAPPTILQKKKKKDVRKVPNTGNRDDPTFVYWIDGMGIGAGCTVVIRVANSD